MLRFGIGCLILATLALTSVQCQNKKAKDGSRTEGSVTKQNEITEEPGKKADSISDEKKKEFILQVYKLGAEPGGISPNSSADVTFTVLVTGGGPTPPKSLQLGQITVDPNSIALIGELKDDGKGADLEPGDRIYTGRFRISSKNEGKLFYRTFVRYSGRDYFSETCSISITGFSIGPAPSDPNFLVEDPGTGQRLYSNEVVVAFVKNTTPKRIKEIVSGEGAVIIGTIPSLGVFQLCIRGDGTAKGVYFTIEALKTHKEVKYAEPNYAAELDNEL